MAETEPKWHYEKLDEKGVVELAPMDDADGKITGHHVFGLKAWFDENPERRIELGWIKHIEHSTKDVEYDHATQYLQRQIRTIDAYTVEDEYYIMTYSEEQLRLKELGEMAGWYDDDESVFIWGVQ